MADDPTAKTQAPSGLGKPAKGGALSKGKSAAGAASGGGARPAEARTQGMYSIDAAGRKTFRRNASVLAQWRDSHWRSAVVLDCKEVSSETGEGTGKFRYYIHYKEFNRRMDEWVMEDRVKEDPSAGEFEEEKKKPHGKAPAPPAPTGGGYGGAGGGASSKAGAKDGEDGAVGKDGKGVTTRGQKRKHDGDEDEDEEHKHDPDNMKVDVDGVVRYVEEEHEGMDEASIREHEEVTKVKNVSFIELGRHRMDTWYFSPFPREFYPDGITDCLFFNEFSLKFFRFKSELLRHSRKFPLRHPPGSEIYRKDDIAVFEVDGAKERDYCQNLSYLAKLFLDHKTLFWDVDPFFFYIVNEVDEYGYHPVGYFSKEKYSEQGYNLACILTLPCFQRKGFGRFIIQFSYELSKKEGKVGSPEKPLSDLGFLSYRSYWSWVLLGILRSFPAEEVSIMDLTKLTSIKPEDIAATLQYLGLIRYVNGQHIICADPRLIEDRFQRLNKRDAALVDPSRIHWAALPLLGRKDKWSISAKMKRQTIGDD